MTMDNTTEVIDFINGYEKKRTYAARKCLIETFRAYGARGGNIVGIAYTSKDGRHVEIHKHKGKMYSILVPDSNTGRGCMYAFTAYNRRLCSVTDVAEFLMLNEVGEVSSLSTVWPLR